MKKMLSHNVHTTNSDSSYHFGGDLSVGEIESNRKDSSEEKVSLGRKQQHLEPARVQVSESSLKSYKGYLPCWSSDDDCQLQRNQSS